MDCPAWICWKPRPTILRGLMAELSEEDVRWKPAPDRFSVAEVLAHLSPHRRPLLPRAAGPFPERRQSRVRTRRRATPPGPLSRRRSRGCLRPFRGAARDQHRIPCATSRQRRRAASPLHKEVGPITLAQMLHEWALHDLGHIRQVAELVRARKYLAGAGPLGSFYQLKP